METVGLVQTAVHLLRHHHHLHLQVQSALPLEERLLGLPVSSLSFMLGSATPAAQLLVAMLHGVILKLTLLVLVSEGNMVIVELAQLALQVRSQPHQPQQQLHQQQQLQKLQQMQQEHLVQSALLLGARLLGLPVSSLSSITESAILAVPLLVALLPGATLKLTLLVLVSVENMETVGLARLAVHQLSHPLRHRKPQQPVANVGWLTEWLK